MMGGLLAGVMVVALGVLPRYTSVTVIVSMGLTSVPITSKSYLQFTSLLMCCTIYAGYSLVAMKG